MVSSASIPPHQIEKHGMRPRCVRRKGISLRWGGTADVFRVFTGPVRVIAMFMEITEAVPGGTVNMSWLLRSDVGGTRTIGDTVDIAPSAIGDFYVAELDGTAIVQVTTASGLIHGYWYEEATANGTILTEGGIDIKLSAHALAGEATLYVYYQPLVNDACVVAEDTQTSSTSTSTTTSTTSSTGSTSSTTSSTSSTASTASTASTTTTSSSTSSTTSTTSSTASTSSTTSSSSSTSSTSSTSTTTSSSSSTASTTSTTTSWPPEVP